MLLHVSTNTPGRRRIDTRAICDMYINDLLSYPITINQQKLMRILYKHVSVAAEKPGIGRMKTMLATYD